MRKDSQRRGYHRLLNAFDSCSVALIIGLIVFAGPCPAKAIQDSSGTSDPRSTPAPWRPAFGAINRDAVGSENGTAPQQPVDTPEAAGATSRTDNGTPVRAEGSVNGNEVLPSNRQQAGVQSSAPQNLGPGNSNVDPAVQTAGFQTTPAGANLPTDENPAVATVTQRLDRLPNSAGQVWREYDISPYTSKITNHEAPQQAIIDWIVRETGTDMWFNQPLGILNANRNQIYVYHTPEIQNVVQRIVDRFVRTHGQLQKMDITLMTVENPNWRSTSYTMLQPIEVRSPGVEAWMISKENAAILQGQLSRRVDAKQSSSGTLTNHDGQSYVLQKRKPVQFVSSLRWVPNQIPNYQPLLTKIDEGYSLSISCLSMMDNSTIEATIKCDVDQVEKLNTVKVNVPGADGSSQQMNLQIPQLVSWRLHERFRWPNDQVLLLSCGVVANLEPETASAIPILGMIPKSKRADALLFIEYRGPATEASVPRAASSGLAPVRPR